MTVKMTFVQRNMLDRVIAAGEDGHPTNFNSATANALIKSGYVEWKRMNDNAPVSRLIATQKGMNFYRS